MPTYIVTARVRVEALQPEGARAYVAGALEVGLEFDEAEAEFGATSAEVEGVEVVEG